MSSRGSRLKVGDWVRFNESGDIGKIIAKCSNSPEWYIQSVPCDESSWSICSEEYFTKLPIKFKEFEVKDICYGSAGILKGVSESRKSPETNTMIRFCTSLADKRIGMFISWVGSPYIIESAPLPIEQAKDWLELQYAKMLTKARGLV